MLTSIISMLPSIVNMIGGIFSDSESDKLAQQIKGQKLKMPASMNMAVESAREQAALGLPGYETYKESINEMIPTTLNQTKEMAQSPSSIIDLAAKSLTASNRAMQNLNVQDAAAKESNVRNYQNVLGNKAAMEMGIQQGNINTMLSGFAQEAQGNKDLMQGITNAAGSAVSGYATMKGLDYQDQVLQGMLGYFKQGTPGASELNPVSSLPKEATFENTNMNQPGADPTMAMLMQFLLNRG